MTKDEALELALEALEGGHLDRAYGYIQAALAQPAQQEHPEQMARLGGQYLECPACGSEGARAFPKPEQEPVAWIDDDGNLHRDEPPYSYGPDPRPLYLVPPQRQPLTHEQRLDLLNEFAPSKYGWDAESILIDMVEAAHDIGDKT